MKIDESVYNDLDNSRSKPTDLLVEEFLIHFGVKGMQWGVRKNKRESKKIKYQNKGPIRRKSLAVSGVASVGIGALILKRGTTSLPFKAVLGGGSVVAGAAVLKRLNETKLRKQVRELRENKVDKETIRKVEEFLKKNPSGVSS